MPECSCPECIECCTNHPGWFKPGEAEKAAKFLNMSLEDFFKKYLVVDYWIGELNNISNPKLLTPAKPPATEPGTIVSWSSPFQEERCIFLNKNDRCMIHPVKPFECAHAMGCDENQESSHAAVAKAWTKPKHQYQINKLLEN